MSKPNLGLFERKVFQTQRTLIRKADNGDLCNNFGSKEVRKLKAIATLIINDGTRPQVERDRTSKAMREFTEWTKNYKG